MKFKFEDLEVWQLSMDLINKIYELSKKYPEIERYNLRYQLISSIPDIPASIRTSRHLSIK